MGVPFNLRLSNNGGGIPEILNAIHKTQDNLGDVYPSLRVVNTADSVPAVTDAVYNAFCNPDVACHTRYSERSSWYTRRPGHCVAHTGRSGRRGLLPVAPDASVVNESSGCWPWAPEV